MNHRSDVELIAAAQRDPEQFSALWERYHKRVFGYAYKLARNREDAEDTMAEVFISAFRRLPEYEHRGHPYIAYLMTLTRNHVWRRRYRERIWVEGDPWPFITETEPDPIETVLRDESADQIMKLLRKIAPLQAKVLIATYIHGHTQPETARMVGKTPGAVKQLSNRGRAAMAAMI